VKATIEDSTHLHFRKTARHEQRDGVTRQIQAVTDCGDDVRDLDLLDVTPGQIDQRRYRVSPLLDAPYDIFPVNEECIRLLDRPKPGTDGTHLACRNVESYGQLSFHPGRLVMMLSLFHVWFRLEEDRTIVRHR
jgi:hypothetical protein